MGITLTAAWPDNLQVRKNTPITMAFNLNMKGV